MIKKILITLGIIVAIFILIIAIIIGSIFIRGCQSALKDKIYMHKSYDTYRNEQYGISISCPKGWGAFDKPDIGQSSSTLVEFYGVSKTPINPKIELQMKHKNPRHPDIDFSSAINYARTGIAKRQKNIPNFELIEGPTEVTINGKKVIKVVSKGYMHEYEDYYFLKNNTLFAVSMLASPLDFNEFRTQFDESINSLKY